MAPKLTLLLEGLAAADRLLFSEDDYNDALQAIDILLNERCGRSLGTIHGMPTPANYSGGLSLTERLEAQEAHYDRETCRSSYQERLFSLNVEQRAVWDSIRPCIDNNEPLCAFIDGRAGTGKTFLYNLILAYVRSQGQVALAVATSGVAALLLDGGRTAHSRFRLPLDVHELSTCNVPKQSLAPQPHALRPSRHRDAWTLSSTRVFGCCRSALHFTSAHSRSRARAADGV